MAASRDEAEVLPQPRNVMRQPKAVPIAVPRGRRRHWPRSAREDERDGEAPPVLVDDARRGDHRGAEIRAVDQRDQHAGDEQCRVVRRDGSSRCSRPVKMLT